MNTSVIVRSTLAVSVVLFGSSAANAACVISGVRPTVPLPTMAVGQEFSFIATADCDRLRFTVPGTTLAKVPRSGPDLGSKDRTYKVVLTEAEWNSVVDASGTGFTWSIVGMTSAGAATRVTTTNELKFELGGTIDLTIADAKLVWEGSDYRSFVRATGAGDVDGDGHDDVLASAISRNKLGLDAGAAYLVLGPVTGMLDLHRPDAKLLGEEEDDHAGSDVSGAGDVDGDGHDDLLVGAYHNDEGGPDAGAAYLILGPVTGALDLSLADAKLVGEAVRDAAGSSVADAGDVDDDGHDDFLVGAWANDEGGPNAGAAYLVLGPVTGTLDLSLADAKLVRGEASYYLPDDPMSGAGDVDGDGYDDVLVGWSYSERRPGAGAAYLMLGPYVGTLDLSLADAKLVGEGPNDQAGWTVSGAGDPNGDGRDDLLVGAPGNREGGWYAGAAYLVQGPVTGTLDLARADAKLVGEAGKDLAGNGVSDAGDVDDDGHDDLLVGAPGVGYFAGAAYLVLGPVTGTVNLSLADAKLMGSYPYNRAGKSVSAAGDVDGDRHDDFLVSSDGRAFLVYGGSLF